MLDVEGTLFQSTVRLPGTELDSTVWQGLAQALGKAAESAEIETHKLWQAGGYGNYLDWMSATIDIHIKHGMTRVLFDAVVSGAVYQPNVVQTIQSLDRSTYEPVLVSGGFRELARRAQLDMQVRHAFAACEYLFDSAGHIAGYNLLPCDFAGKIDFVRLMLREYALGEQDWIFIGDGANDVEIALAAPFSIGMRPHPALREVVDIVITDFAQLPAVLRDYEAS